MQIKMTITKTKEEGKYNVKYATSVGGKQDRLKDVSLKEASEHLEKVIKAADEAGYVGKK